MTLKFSNERTNLNQPEEIDQTKNLINVKNMIGELRLNPFKQIVFVENYL